MEGNPNVFSEIDMKLMTFIAGGCLPIVLVTGLYGTKLQIRITNCTSFHYNFPNISQACGFNKNCQDGYEHIFWLSERFENSKDTKCTGEILRLGHESYTKRNHLQKEDKDLGFNITFYGNTPITYSDRQCGFGSTSDLFDKFSYFTKTAPRGTKDFKDYFTNLGYEVGLNLFAAPIDWRLRANDDHNYKMVKETVDFAYNVTQKPVLLIGHSYGGLISLSYLYRMSEQEKLKKVSRFITIGTPFLSVPKIVKFAVLGTDEFNTVIDIIGYKVVDLFISMNNQKIIAEGNPASFELFPKDFMKNHKNETYIQLIFKRAEAENRINNCIKKLYSKFKDTFLFNDNMIEKTCILPIMNFYKKDLEEFNKYFPFFPKLEPGCGRKKMNLVTCETESCPSVWDTYCRLNFHNILKHNIFEFKNGDKDIKINGTNTQDLYQLWNWKTKSKIF